jgi:hypothetical protein
MKNRPKPKTSRIRIKKSTKAQLPKPAIGACSAANSAIIKPPFILSRHLILKAKGAEELDVKNQDWERGKDLVFAGCPSCLNNDLLD